MKNNKYIGTHLNISYVDELEKTLKNIKSVLVFTEEYGIDYSELCVSAMKDIRGFINEISPDI